MQWGQQVQFLSPTCRALMCPVSTATTVAEDDSSIQCDTSSADVDNDYGISSFINKSVGRDDIYNQLTRPCTLSTGYTYPKTEMYGKKRSFQPSWIVTFPRIVYSPSCDGIFCKHCMFFAKLKGYIVGSFIKAPVKNWTKALGECKAHDKMSHHQTALKMSEDFLSTYRDPTTAVDVRGQSAMVERINANREILKSIASTVLFCGRQNIALRGHRDDATNQDDSINRGNFHEMLQFRIDAGDSSLERHLTTASRRATYISKTIQNQLIGIIGNQIRDGILDEVRKAKFFSILADEVIDSSNWEQLSLVVRYVDMTNTIKEQFICFLNCESVTGEALTKRICDTLQDLDLPIENMRGQGYDGGSNMAGHVKGVQGRITAINDNAIMYIVQHTASTSAL